MRPAGESRSYKLYGEHENTYLMDNLGGTAGSEATGGTTAFGLFGAVNVEPFQADWYRSQVTRADMDLAASAWTGSDADGWAPVDQPQVDGAGKLKIRLTADGQPVVNYAARYPTDPATPGYDAARAGRPILNMLDGTNVVHADINGVISGPAADGYRLPKRDYPKSYWNNEVYNLGDDRGQEPFREFTVIFHDEIKALQAFPEFDDPKLQKTVAGIKDGFAINYGTGGIGAEILANRKGVGPMWDCTDCKFEEFFLTSWAVGDPAMVVDVPANKTKKDANGNFVAGTRATKAFFPDDPSNVHHSYINDRVKFRNLHAGPKEHHIFHLHTHQWQMNPNTEKSAYLDSQMIGPGAGYTYEIAYGGSGNRNKIVGDAIFHCHFYPHFAQGMWEMWRSHDTFERGTQLDADGTPAAGSRALPDGEITAGTPIPAVVPLPNRPMAPMPDAATTVVPYDLTGDHTDAPNSSQTDADGDGVADVAQGFANAPKTNAGFPFFVPGVAGHRPPSPPLDMVDVDNDGQVEDGGLPRHVIVGGTATHYETPLDFDKIIDTAKVAYVPEKGTPTEQKAMDFHAQLWHPTFLSNSSATPLDGTHPATAKNGRPIKGFETNGLPPIAGAPFAEPCRTDPDLKTGDVSKVPTNRTYKATAVQIDAKINKAGWHFPQQRILALNQDVGDTLSGARAPQPLTMRLDVNDCANYEHTNLVPNTYQLDDFEVRTPTDIVGQHIHLVKFDVTSADGSANGFNYEDGTLSPQEVTERVDAIRKDNGCAGDGRLDPGETATPQCPLARKHPFFGGVAGVGDLAWGARTTMQRWFADPVLNHAWDRSLGTVFTHDHFGPSTHQQVGLYATVLVEPEGSEWTDSETGVAMGTRADGGPTSWRADIKWPAGDSRNENAHREFYFELADFQHAYQAGGGKLHTQDNGAGKQIPSYADFPNAINPSLRQEPPSGHEADLYWNPPTCANGTPRPCPEAISVDDVGTYVVNYRNEPVGLRVFDPAAKKQAIGGAGDLALAFQSRTDRAIPALNTQPGFYPPLTSDLAPGDPWTPMMRVYMGDKVLVRSQVGAHEEEHTLMIHGVKWRQEALNLNSGWRDSQGAGISEYFQFQAPVLPNAGPGQPNKEDYLYTMGAATDDLWNGIWGLMRSYHKERADLKRLPNNDIPTAGWNVSNSADFDGLCPKSSVPAKPTVVRAVRAADVLNADGKPRQPGDGAGRLVYNSRATTVRDANGKVVGSGPLVDPTALLYVLESDVIFDNGDPKTGRPVGLKAGTPVEPLVLRTRAGDCVKLELWNDLPATVPDKPGFEALPAIVHKDEAVNGGVVSFNANDLTPSSMVGMHPQLLAYDVRSDDGLDVGGNSPKLIAPGTKKSYTWYAGDVQAGPDGAGGLKFVAKPVEFGASNLMPADRIKGFSKGMIGTLLVEPPGATWTTDPGSRASATVTYPDGGATKTFREFATVHQDDVNLRYAGGCTSTAANLDCAVGGIASETSPGASEDPEDSGSKALNYGSDPVWYRLGLAPGVPFTDPKLVDNPDIHRVFADELVGGDPKTPVFTADAGSPMRFRIVQPGGHARGHVWGLNGHAWQRQPYIADSDRQAGTEPLPDPTRLCGSASDPDCASDTNNDGVTSTQNLISWWVGSQEGVSASSHFDVNIPQAGGPFGATGDFVFRDSGSLGSYQGLWGLLRVK